MPVSRYSIQLQLSNLRWERIIQNNDTTMQSSSNINSLHPGATNESDNEATENMRSAPITGDACDYTTIDYYFFPKSMGS